jgi:hypothetical protein
MRQLQRWGVKLPGLDYCNDSNIHSSVGLDGMVKLTELPSTYRHARKCES